MTKDLTQGNVWKVIITFSIPLLISSIVQQLYNAADCAIVGNLDNATGLAALGATTPIVHFVVGICTGAGMGCTVVISKLFGERKFHKLRAAVSTCVIALGVLGIAVSLIGILMAGQFMTWLGVNKDVFDGAEGYLAIYCVGAFPMLIYNAAAAAFTGMGDSRRPLYFLIASSVLNVILDIIAVGPMQRSVRGAAWATVISQFFVAAVAIISIVRKMKKFTLELQARDGADEQAADVICHPEDDNALQGSSTDRKRWFDRDIFAQMSKVAIPCIFQQISVSIGHILIQRLVNTFSTSVMAGYEVGAKIVNFNYGCYNAMATGLMSFAGQNFGAKRADRCRQGLKATIVICAAFSSLIAILGNIFSDQLVSMFVNTSEANIEEVIIVGANYIKIVLIDLIFVSVALSLGGLMRGVGDVKVFVVATIADLGTRVVMCYVLTEVMNSYLGLYWAWYAGMIVDIVICFAWYFLQCKKGKLRFDNCCKMTAKK